ncbi:exodeoxyribonuclease V subunit beta [Shewanella intestini]|uniref:RecBCD enzyme subunit RecB n=1 Tax=Shewanella intestini TaxID=2017544 RepID=A0ABS5I5F1_9GAMM|nr:MULTISPECIES: exodeoxyribonuclease V subunit beta [Shewanella]MBR9729236.1 exodeoxyribonuclease V subunit beta [Shewanella intestini]MRG35381.1 exodeoxyribonuclease V subunit beta [Shewanella sp. XMDDZSB0408]
MNTHTVSPLQPISLPFNGSSLIEASAGTGKTYTISGLYLRLLLGHGGQSPLSCEQILVVTFTNAATQELRDRIRKRIQQAFKRFIGLPTNDEFIEQLYQQTPEEERSTALKRFDLALKTLDEAAIYTIHGFCQRVLSDMAFESSLLFESEFTLDDSEYLHHAVRDFWREVCYSLSPTIAGLVSNHIATPDLLAHKLRPLLGAAQAKLTITPSQFIELSENLVSSINRFKKSWIDEQAQTYELLISLPLNGVRFGKKADGYPKLQLQFEQLSLWAEHGQGLPPSKALEQLALSGLKLNKGGEIPTKEQAPLLDQIERLSSAITEIIPAFLVRAQQGIKQRFNEQKQQRNLMTPDDLLVTLANAIDTQGSQLSQAIAKRFPIALIDEFQDTDPLQFKIFNQVYQPIDANSLPSTAVSNTSALGLLMIGDPKQAIYAFRGADIYTYIAARNQTQARFNLATNYRSSAGLVHAVNAIFNQHHDPFINQAIPFDLVNTPPSAANKVIIESPSHQQAQATQTENNNAALQIRLLAEHKENGLNKTDARQMLSDDAANEIARLLTLAAQGNCNINGAALRAKDIAVLVRDRNEAAVIKVALTERQIGAVFLSRDSVFNTNEAAEVALLLHALAAPKDERKLRAALATQLFGYNAEQIHQFNQHEAVRQQLLDQFMQWHELWLHRGVMPALLRLASDTHLVSRLLSQAEPAQNDSLTDDDDDNLTDNSGERRLTDFRHLSELLQQKATELDGSSALINWFEQQLIDASGQDEQQLRLESEQNLVQIVTIHKSKGLEYPVCFVPFISLARSSSRRPDPLLYHDDTQLVWDLNGTDEGWDKHKQEVLAEDLRLLYVALTRPVYRCYMGIANQSRQLKAGISSQLYQTGIGYLLGITDKSCTIEDIVNRTQALAQLDCIDVSLIEACAATALTINATNNINYCAKPLTRGHSTPWRVGSYSGLVKHLPHEKTQPGADDEDFSQETNPLLNVENDNVDAVEFNRFSFERGANAGSFMHLVMELFDFTQAETQLQDAIINAMKQYGFDTDIWLAPLHEWYQQILTTPLPLNEQHNIYLANLAPQQVLVEMEFYLPLTQLKANDLNQLLTQYGYEAGFSFDTLKGMLKGFIDLTFEYQGKYYIADYKSNHLGDTFDAYHLGALSKAINSHRYNLQYILYTLALHRFLKLRLPQYQYHTHMGGSYYLFLRGMTPSHPGSGVFYDLPPQQLIEQLDALFTTPDTINSLVGNTSSVQGVSTC